MYLLCGPFTAVPSYVYLRGVTFGEDIDGSADTAANDLNGSSNGQCTNDGSAQGS